MREGEREQEMKDNGGVGRGRRTRKPAGRRWTTASWDQISNCSLFYFSPERRSPRWEFARFPLFFTPSGELEATVFD